MCDMEPTIDTDRKQQEVKKKKKSKQSENEKATNSKHAVVRPGILERSSE